ncbi:MAG: mechanosensitive ion channel family protein [Candidatus Sedimenticola sp. (ex Thyasira tokunagai)]
MSELIYEYFTLLELLLLSANLILLAFSRPLLQLLNSHQNENGQFKDRLHIFRLFNVLVLLFVVINALVLPVAEHSRVVRILTSILIVYLAYLTSHLLNYFIKKRFGKKREVNEKEVLSETYNSRVLSLLSSLLLFVMALIAIVQILGFDSLLEAGGVIGFVGVLLALTQGAWAPDIISGLVILNSKLFNEGDVIELNEGSVPIICVVHKTKVFHTELLNLVNNHRIMLQNSNIRSHIIQNLSRFASAKGLRESMEFNIGYEVDEERVRAMFDSAYQRVIEDADILIEKQHPLEVRALAAGDYAVQWAIFYYIKDVKKLLNTRQLFLSVILEAARQHEISLATPLLHQGAQRCD